MKNDNFICEGCGNQYDASCDWNQGRCPNHPSLLDQILNDPYKSRFYNLFKLFSKKNDNTQF